MSHSSSTLTRRSGDISALDAISILDDDDAAVLIDVRPEAGHPRALAVPFDDDTTFLEALADAVPDTARLVLVIDAAGARSDRAADLAAGAGYRRVLNVADGFAGLDASCDSLIPESFRTD